jgi:hypothetical protein
MLPQHTAGATPAAISGPEATRAHDRLSLEEGAIARSVLFASLFDYPLTLAELRQTLIESTQTPTAILTTLRRSERLRDVIDSEDGFFFPRGRSDLIQTRRRRESQSRAFIQCHQRFLRLAGALPYVRFIALSGSVAHLNLDGDGDLDLFVITRGRHAWSVTVALVVLAKLMRRRRVVCANFVMADSRLEVDEQDLFSASQLLHLRPIYGHEAFQELLAANGFVYQYYPNAYVSRQAGVRAMRGPSLGKRTVEKLCASAAWVVEGVCRFAYRKYLRARADRWESPEQVRLDADRLKLHTRSHRRSVSERFARTSAECDVDVGSL